MDRTQQMTAVEVALEANVSTRTFSRWIDRGLPCTKYSSRLIRIKRSDIDDREDAGPSAIKPPGDESAGQLVQKHPY